MIKFILNIFKIKTSMAIIISLILFSIIISFSILSLSDFFKYQKVVDPYMQLDLKRFHFFLKNKIDKEILKYTSPSPLSDNKSQLKTFSITVDPNDIRQLNSNLPQSGKEQYVDAYMKISDVKNIKKIKLRYRGDNNYHWLYDKKSLRIKLLSNNAYNMDKTFNLINPTNMYSFRDIINYKLSKNMGLISPDCYAVRVKLNGRYMGVYLYISQVDESLLRKHKIMPGSIYYGDILDGDNRDFLWKNSNLWDKKAARNAEQKLNRDDIKLFIDAINNFDEQKFNNFVETFLNKDKFFNFIALDRLLGTHHHDYTHNHKIYFDPYKGKFEPISWDIRFWLDIQQKDLSLYPLQLRLSSNPIYDAIIDKIVYNSIQNGIYDKILKDYDDVINTILPDLKSDIYRDRAIHLPNISPKTISEPFTIEQLQHLIKADTITINNRKKYLLNLYNKTKFSYNTKKLSDNKIKLIITVDGNNPILVDFGNNKQILYPMKKIVKGTQKIFSTKSWGDSTVQNYPKQYEFILDTTKQSLKDIKYYNYITTKEIIKQAKDIKNITLKGTIEVNKTLVFDRFTQVNIQKGTIFKLYPKQSIYFYGKVIAKGTKQNPIRFIPKDKNKPWGLVAVQGKDASGSIFEYCEFLNGSVDYKNLISYTSPFNLHNLDDFRVSNSTIGRNFIGDDAMHIAYSKGIVENSIFNNARSDALDIDISDVIIRNNIFKNSGNDALDIMTTTMIADNNTFKNTGDKGISVGEWSNANIKNSTFENTLIGIEIKDKSKVTASNLIFINAIDKAINLYNKNKRYNTGGFLKATNLKFIGNNIIKADKDSKYEIK